MAGPIRIAILAQGASARREMRATAAVGTSMGSSLSKAGRLAAVGLGAATVAAVALGKRAVTAASASQQSVGATESVYGKYADTVIKRSEQAAEAIGLSANEYRELANVSGAMLKSSELPLKRVTDLTAQLNRRAADVAATFGGTTREAVEAFNALLRGETDPVERYGVAVKATDVSARLAAKGQDELTGAALKQASAIARLDLLFQQTKSSQGQFRRESDTLAGQQQRLGAEIENLEAKVGAVLLPTLTDLAVYARREVVPMLEDAADWFEKNQDEISDFASAAGGELLDALRRLQPYLADGVELAKDAVEAWEDLPGPVKDVAVQLGLVAAVWPRVNGVLGTSITSLGDYTRKVRDAETRTAALGRAARGAAGIGGVLSLTQATQESNETLKRLYLLAGGAGTGFALGGPIGALVGLVGAGTLIQLTKQTDGASDSFREAYGEAGTYADTLDRVSGAITRVTRAEAAKVLQDRGAFDIARQLGVSYRDLTGAVLGNENAIGRVERQVQRYSGVSNIAVDSMGNFTVEQSALAGQAAELANILGIETDALSDQQKETRDLAIASGELVRSLKGIDRATARKITSRIEMRGWPEGERQIGRVIRGLVNVGNRKQIRTVLKTLGADESVRDVQRVLRELRRADRARGQARVEVETKAAKTDLAGWQRALVTALKSGERSAVQGGHSVRRGLEDGPGKARSNLGPFVDSIRTGVGPAKSTASSGGNQVGANLKAGVLSGFAGTAALLAAQAASAVRQAVAAAKREGEIRSPSRRMNREVGKPLAQGITEGFIDGVREGSTGVERALDKLLEKIEKKYDGKKQAARRKALIRSLRDERAQLVKNGKAQDRVNRLLERAEQRYKNLRASADQFAKSIKSGFQTYGSVVGLGTTGDSSIVTLPALLSQLTARASIAEQFNQVIESLRGKLNRTSLRQLLNQAASGDLESALATAQAIASGEQGAIQQINELTAQITAAGDKLGAKMRREFFGHGLEIAEGTVKGLEKRQRELDRIAARLAKAFLQEAGMYAGQGNKQDKSGGSGPSKRTAASVDAYLRTGTATATTPVAVKIELTAQQLSEIEKGRKIQVSLDAYHGAGGRAKVRTP